MRWLSRHCTRKRNSLDFRSPLPKSRQRYLETYWAIQNNMLMCVARVLKPWKMSHTSRAKWKLTKIRDITTITSCLANAVMYSLDSYIWRCLCFIRRSKMWIFIPFVLPLLYDSETCTLTRDPARQIARVLIISTFADSYGIAGMTVCQIGDCPVKLYSGLLPA